MLSKLNNYIDFKSINSSVKYLSISALFTGTALGFFFTLVVILAKYKNFPEGIIGISVPGMPMGSPGMEGEYKEDYPVFLFDSEGTMYFHKMK